MAMMSNIKKCVKKKKKKKKRNVSQTGPVDTSFKSIHSLWEFFKFPLQYYSNNISMSLF